MLTPEQIILIGIVASAITFLLRALFTYFNVSLGRLTVNILLYIVAAVLAVVWTHPALPPFSGDVAGWVSAVFQLAAPVVGLAALVYNALYSQVIVPLWAKMAKK